MRAILIILSVYTVLSGCSGNKNNMKDLSCCSSFDSMLTSLHDRDKFSGNVLVAVGDTILFKASYGYADRDNKKLLNDSTIFELASISKQFTAAGILLLQERGLLNYNDMAICYLPELPYPDITLYQLLTHTSGIPDYIPMIEAHWDKSKIAGNKDVLKLFHDYGPKASYLPGERMEYSDAGYIMLALIIERISHIPYSQFMKEQIFQPLGMEKTFVCTNRYSTPKLPYNTALGYVFSDTLQAYILPGGLQEYQYLYYLDAIEGEGKINSTITDLLKWHRSIQTHKILSDTTMQLAFSIAKLKNGHDAMMEPIVDSTRPDYYGFGYFIEEIPELGKVVYHSGGYEGFRSYLWHAVDQKVSFILTANTFSEEARLCRTKMIELITAHFSKGKSAGKQTP
jgi:CubicO group peptidase (beta-lactamase class C family)